MTHIAPITPTPVLLKAYPELRNSRYYDCYLTGRRQRLDKEINGQTTQTVPLFSYHPTYQSAFAKGWYSVTSQDIRLSRVKNHA